MMMIIVLIVVVVVIVYYILNPILFFFSHMVPKKCHSSPPQMDHIIYICDDIDYTDATVIPFLPYILYFFWFEHEIKTNSLISFFFHSVFPQKWIFETSTYDPYLQVGFCTLPFYGIIIKI